MMIIYLYSPQDLDYNSIDPRFSTYLIIEYFVESRKSTRKDTPPPCWRMFSIPFSPVDSCTLGSKVIIIFSSLSGYTPIYIFFTRLLSLHFYISPVNSPHPIIVPSMDMFWFFSPLNPFKCVASYFNGTCDHHPSDSHPHQLILFFQFSNTFVQAYGFMDLW